MQEFDLFVIGAGSGGVRCARIAAQHGARVGIVERRHWGGTCVNLGCVPKKLMVYAADSGRAIEDAPAWGWEIGTAHPVHNWQKFMAGKNAEIVRLNKAYISMLEKSGVQLFTGEARFLEANIIEIGPSPLAPNMPPQRVKAKKIVIATGSAPSRPEIAGADLAITSDEVFSLPERPRRVAIIGGGYIGVEFAGIFAGLGSEVSLVYRQDLPLRGFDGALRQHLQEALSLNKIKALPQTSPEKIEKRGDRLNLVLSGGQELEIDAVMMATGRHPRISGLNLEKAGIATEGPAGREHIRVDSRFATSTPSVYAIGDVTDRYNLTPTAIAEGHLLAENLFAPQGRQWSFETTPKAVFFTSPLASVGLTEEEAAATYKCLAIYSTSFTPMKQSLSKRPGKVLMKLVVDAESDLVLGAHMMGPDAPEIIQILAIAVTARLTKREIDRTIALHPSTAEEFVTMRVPVRFVPPRPAEPAGTTR